MKACVYPGSFDPITNGHMDIIKRACGIFDKVYVGILRNPAKKYYFDLADRVGMVRSATKDLNNAEVVSFDGLLVDLLRKLDCSVVVRGLRSYADLDLEQQLAAVNEKLLPGTETVAFLARPETSFISSTAVRELLSFNADIAPYVPEQALKWMNGECTDENL